MIQVLERAMGILDAVSREPTGFTVMRLAKKLSLNRGTCSTIVQTLVQGGYLLKILTTGNYVLGPRPYGLTRRRYFLHDLVFPAKSFVDERTRLAGCPCLVAAIFPHCCFALYTARPERGTPHDEEVVELDDLARAQMTGFQVPITVGGVSIKPGDVIMADIDGALVIPRKRAVPVLKRAEQIEQNEGEIKEWVDAGLSTQEIHDRGGYF